MLPEPVPVPEREFITFGRSEGIGCVHMQNLLLLAALNALGVCPCRICFFWPKLKSLGVWPCRIWCFWQN